ncbi:MAG: hypothetical protein QNJ42_12835 [Crocosphaera sp.]|nr:hypothetical protein [Crocosphaera sp.]
MNFILLIIDSFLALIVKVMNFILLIIDGFLVWSGFLYGKTGGLRIGLSEDGIIRYANELQSSGGDDTLFVGFLLFLFIIPCIIRLSELNAIFFVIASIKVTIVVFFGLLIMLDVDVFDSIAYGDNYMLLIMESLTSVLILSLSILLYHILKMLVIKIVHKIT